MPTNPLRQPPHLHFGIEEQQLNKDEIKTRKITDKDQDFEVRTIRPNYTDERLLFPGYSQASSDKKDEEKTVSRIKPKNMRVNQ